MKPLRTPRNRWPLYVTVDDAAAFAGVSREMMLTWVHDRIDPIPHMWSGRKALIQVAGIAPYADRRCLKGVGR